MADFEKALSQKFFALRNEAIDFESLSEDKMKEMYRRLRRLLDDSYRASSAIRRLKPSETKNRQERLAVRKTEQGELSKFRRLMLETAKKKYKLDLGKIDLMSSGLKLSGYFGFAVLPTEKWMNEFEQLDLEDQRFVLDRILYGFEGSGEVKIPIDMKNMAALKAFMDHILSSVKDFWKELRKRIEDKKSVNVPALKDSFYKEFAKEMQKLFKAEFPQRDPELLEEYTKAVEAIWKEGARPEDVLPDVMKVLRKIIKKHRKEHPKKKTKATNK